MPRMTLGEKIQNSLFLLPYLPHLYDENHIHPNSNDAILGTWLNNEQYG
jgi:hypothetical protein